MIRTVAVALAALAMIDQLMFAGKYVHLVKQVADSFMHYVF
jgi:hypothetical protein